MRVCIDAYSLDLPYQTGIGVYTCGLASAYRAAGAKVDGLFRRTIPHFSDEALTEITFHRQGATLNDLSFRERARLFAAGVTGTIAATRIQKSNTINYRPIDDTFGRLDGILNIQVPLHEARRFFARTGRFMKIRLPKDVKLMHWTMPVPIRAEGVPNIYTILDVIPFVLPYATVGSVPTEMKMFRKILKTADQIVTISEFSREEISRIFGVDKKPILNTYVASNINADIIGILEHEIEKYIATTAQLQYRNYLLFVGSIEPRKNIDRLIDAYLWSKTELPLVICSSSGWMNKATIARLDDLALALDKSNGSGKEADTAGGKGKRIIRIDKAKNAHVARLMRGARAVLFPSIYEGFGLPVLEAMQLGTPVITSNATSTAEVAGDASILVDPFSVADIAQAINNVCFDDALWSRLAKAGVRRAETFSASAFAERVRVVLDAHRESATSIISITKPCGRESDGKRETSKDQ